MFDHTTHIYQATVQLQGSQQIPIHSPQTGDLEVMLLGALTGKSRTGPPDSDMRGEGDIMQAKKVFQKAIECLDAHRTTQAERALRQALQLAYRERDDLTRGSVLCCLSDLLVAQGRYEEARPFLVHLSRMERDDHSLDLEIDYARDMLGQIPTRKDRVLA